MLFSASKFSFFKFILKIDMFFNQIRNQKVGSTQILNYLTQLGGDNKRPYVYDDAMCDIHENLNRRNFINLKNLTKVTDYSDGVLRFMFVRHPLERLVSAWHDKFSINTKPIGDIPTRIWPLIGSDIIRRFRPNATEEEIKAGHPVSLEEFFKYLVFYKDHLFKINQHWRRMSDICNICIVKYDYIGHLDSMDAELKYIVAVATGQSKVLDVANPDKVYGRDDSELKKIPMELLKDIINIYRDDFDAFGFKVPEWIH